MHIPGVIGSLKTSVVSAVSHVQLTFSVGDSDSPLCLQVHLNRVIVHKAASYTMLTLSSSSLAYGCRCCNPLQPSLRALFRNLHRNKAYRYRLSAYGSQCTQELQSSKSCIAFAAKSALNRSFSTNNFRIA